MLITDRWLDIIVFEVSCYQWFWRCFSWLDDVIQNGRLDLWPIRRPLKSISHSTARINASWSACLSNERKVIPAYSALGGGHWRVFLNWGNIGLSIYTAVQYNKIGYSVKIRQIEPMLFVKSTKDTPYLALTGKLWSVFYEWFWKNCHEILRTCFTRASGSFRGNCFKETTSHWWVSARKT